MNKPYNKIIILANIFSDIFMIRKLSRSADLSAKAPQGTGGESGIRTHGTLRHTRTPIVRLRPLGHLSKFMFRIILSNFSK